MARRRSIRKVRPGNKAAKSRKAARFSTRPISRRKRIAKKGKAGRGLSLLRRGKRRAGLRRIRGAKAVKGRGYQLAYNKAFDQAYNEGFTAGFAKGLQDGAP